MVHPYKRFLFVAVLFESCMCFSSISRMILWKSSNPFPWQHPFHVPLTSQTPPTSLHPPIRALSCWEGRGHCAQPPFHPPHPLLHPPRRLKSLIHRLRPVPLTPGPPHPISYMRCPAHRSITRPLICTPMRTPVRWPWVRGGACWRVRVRAYSWLGKS